MGLLEALGQGTRQGPGLSAALPFNSDRVGGGGGRKCSADATVQTEMGQESELPA